MYHWKIIIKKKLMYLFFKYKIGTYMYLAQKLGKERSLKLWHNIFSKKYQQLFIKIKKKYLNEQAII